MKTLPKDPWVAADTLGLVLRPWQPPLKRRTVVACVILRCADLELLLARAPQWVPAVDRTVVVLGAWSEQESPPALTAAAKRLEVAIPKVDIVMPPARGWPDQVAKRSAYFARCQPGEVAFVVDADEELSEGPQALRAATEQAFDVGWVTITAPHRYERPYGQPRVFEVPQGGLTYRERHYWVFSGDRLVAAHSYGGTGWLHARLPLTLVNKGGRRRPAHHVQQAKEQPSGRGILDQTEEKREAIRIVQLTRYDAGLAVYRLHSAINATTRERSLMISDFADNPLRGLEQYDLADTAQARVIAAGADILHVHVDYKPLTAAGGGRPDQPIIIHHHGTQYRVDPERWDHLDQQAALRLGSTMNLLLLDKSKTMQWLPNPVPVSLYRRMATAARAERHNHELWIAHSPSKPRLKGTGELLAAVERLQAKKLPIRLQLTTGIPHPEALWRKAACDICFDSFWLGIQVSGLEAAAMGMPVIAGDADTAGEYQRRLGTVPYTFADKDTLDAVLERLVVDEAWRATEAQRVGAYTLMYHDEAAVARCYLELIRGALSGQLRARLQDRVRAERKDLAKALRQEVVHPVSPVGGFRLSPKISHL